MFVAEDIYGRVSQVLMETLNVDEEDLTPTATLQGDLGAESIDFLDIVFRLEREFGIDIAEGELFPNSIFQGNHDFVQEGKVTDRGNPRQEVGDAGLRPALGDRFRRGNRRRRARRCRYRAG